LFFLSNKYSCLGAIDICDGFGENYGIFRSDRDRYKDFRRKRLLTDLKNFLERLRSPESIQSDAKVSFQERSDTQRIGRFAENFDFEILESSAFYDEANGQVFGTQYHTV